MNLNPRSLEFVAVNIHANSLVFLLVTIYRPPSRSSTDFWDELSALLERCAASNSRLRLVGDFNAHVGSPTDSRAQHLVCMLDSFGLKQHVSEPTRKDRILDLVISPCDGDFVRECHVTGPMDESDHLTVLASIRARKPKLLMKMVRFHPWKSVDPENFALDLFQSSFVANTSDNFSGLLEQFTCSVSEVLDKHAPWRCRRLVLRPPCTWFNSTIAEARRRCRRSERIWRRLRSVRALEDLKQSKSLLATYYRSKVSELKGDRRALLCKRVVYRSCPCKGPQKTWLRHSGASSTRRCPPSGPPLSIVLGNKFSLSDR